MFLKENIVNKEVQDSLAVAETKLGGMIKEKLGIQCVHDAGVDELFRGIRSQLANLIGGTCRARCRSRHARGRGHPWNPELTSCRSLRVPRLACIRGRPPGERDERHGPRPVAQPVALQAQV